MTAILIVILVITFIASLLAWHNTNLIRKDLERIKDHLDIHEKRKTSLFDRDLDND
jgi:uncharacterized protein YxeA